MNDFSFIWNTLSYYTRTLLTSGVNANMPCMLQTLYKKKVQQYQFYNYMCKILYFNPFYAFYNLDAIEAPGRNRSLVMNVIVQHIILSSGIVELTKNEPVDNPNNL